MSDQLKRWQDAFLNGLQSNDPKQNTISSRQFLDNNRIIDPLSIYRNNYKLSLKSWLKKTYPMVNQLIGEQCFQLLAESYTLHYPLTANNTFTYCVHFEKHIKALLNNQASLNSVPYLADFAKLEWCLYLSYYSKDRQVFSFDEFAKLNEPQQQAIRFQLADDIYMVTSTWPLYELWEFCNEEKPLESVTQNHRERYFLIERENTNPTVVEATLSEQNLINSIKEGKPLSCIDDSAIECIPQWIQASRITGFKARL